MLCRVLQVNLKQSHLTTGGVAICAKTQKLLQDFFYEMYINIIEQNCYNSVKLFPYLSSVASCFS